jgi:hypothetical protein
VTLNLLTISEVRGALAAGLDRELSDGGGLVLRIRGGKAAWQWRIRHKERKEKRGLGPVDPAAIGPSLTKARKMAAELNACFQAGEILPRTRRAAGEPDRAGGAALAGKPRTFAEAVEAYLHDNELKWTNPKHRRDWRSSLATYATPKLGAHPVESLTVADIVMVLKPYWKRTEDGGRVVTMSRVRERIALVIDYWAAINEVVFNNPAKWDRLKAILPSPAHAPARPRAPSNC